MIGVHLENVTVTTSRSTGDNVVRCLRVTDTGKTRNAAIFVLNGNVSH